jgi:hypothetical protein
MKKTLQLIAVLALGASLHSQAQTQRINLFEEWTGENCAPCAATNPGITAIANANFSGPKKMILLRYQVPIPSAPTNPNSLYQQNPTEPSLRQDYYYPTPTDQFAPQGRLNGHELGRGDVNGNNGNAGFLSQDSVDFEYQVDAPFSLTTGYVWNATYDSLTITTVITAAQNFTAVNPLTLQLAITEEFIHYNTAPGSNGEKDFEYIMRKMVPDENGLVLSGSWTNGQTQTIVNKVKLPTYIWNKAEVAITAFIQEDVPNPGPLVTRTVHQAAYGDPQALPINATAAAVTGLSNYICTNTFDPTFELKNSGLNDLTSCDINYQIDNGTIGTINWTGNLTTGQSNLVVIPTQTSALGAHTFKVNVSNVNGSSDANLNDNALNIAYQNINIAPVFPLFEGFETTFPLTNWERINPDASTTWARTTTAKKTGLASVRLDNANYQATGQIDEFRLPPIDISTATNPNLTFQVAYSLWTNPALAQHWSDTLEVFVSTDCGASFISVYKKFDATLSTNTPLPYQGSDFVPAANEWRLETIDLTPYVGTSNLLVKFRNVNDYENILYIDDINVLETTVGIIKNNSFTDLEIFPNPANDAALVKVYSSVAEKTSLNLINSLGQLVISKEVAMVNGENSFEISTADLANGVYLLDITTSNGKTTKKLVVNH